MHEHGAVARRSDEEVELARAAWRRAGSHQSPAPHQGVHEARFAYVRATGEGDQVWGSSYIFNSVVEGGWPDGWEILDEDPQFLDPEAGNVRVSRRSPCVNLGFMYYVPDDAKLDLAGNARVVCDAIDAEGEGRVRAGGVIQLGQAGHESPGDRERGLPIDG